MDLAVERVEGPLGQYHDHGVSLTQQTNLGEDVNLRPCCQLLVGGHVRFDIKGGVVCRIKRRCSGRKDS